MRVVQPRWLRVSGLSLTFCVAFQASQSLRAQGLESPELPSNFISTAAPFDAASPETVEDRDRQFAALAEDVSALEPQLNLLKRIVKLVEPTVVHIEASKLSEPGQGFASSRVEEAGAGVVVEHQGRHFVLTNRHVIHASQPKEIRIEFSHGLVMYPKKVWSDASTDIAVMEVDSDCTIASRLGDSEEVDIGDHVLAVGSPFGLNHSVSYGIVSAKGRRNLELGTREIEIQDFFQTDAAINPGNSGGPLLNLRGEVIGINTAIASNSGGNEGIGFSIPIKMAMLVATQLIENGKLPRAYLGVQLDGQFDLQKARQLGLPAPRGALIKAVKPESPAAAAGLKFGDVVLEFDDSEIENDGHLLQTAGLTPVGREVQMRVLRNGKMYRVPVTLREYPE